MGEMGLEKMGKLSQIDPFSSDFNRPKLTHFSPIFSFCFLLISHFFLLSQNAHFPISPKFPSFPPIFPHFTFFLCFQALTAGQRIRPRLTR